MQSNTQNLLAIANRVLERTKAKNSPKITQALEKTIRELEANPDRTLLLYSLSQAGKSTLFSLLTLGEQYVPVGLGKATTAVVIELIEVPTTSEARAEIKWLSPNELMALVSEPLKPYLNKQGINRQGGSASNTVTQKLHSTLASIPSLIQPSNSEGDELGNDELGNDEPEDVESGDEAGEDESGFDFSSLDGSSLADPNVRKAFFKALTKARNMRAQRVSTPQNPQQETRQGSSQQTHVGSGSATDGSSDGSSDDPLAESDDLAAAEVILRQFSNYRAVYQEGFVPVELDQLHDWTRQPFEWDTKPISQFRFEELRCFFVQRVRLYAPTHPMSANIPTIDGPGFGVSSFHNSIIRGNQRHASAVLLLLGASASQITTAQLLEIQQLSLGSRDNLYVLWNPKSGTYAAACQLLADDLKRIETETGIHIPNERAAVVNLLLGLRATQWQKLNGDGENDTEKLSPMTIRALSDAAQFNYQKANSEVSRFRSRTSFSAHAALPEDEEGRARYLVKNQLKITLDTFLGAPAAIEDMDELAEVAAAESGIQDALPELFETMRNSCPHRRADDCALASIKAIEYFLARFPSSSEVGDIEKDIAALRAILGLFNQESETALEKLQESIANNFRFLAGELIDALIHPPWIAYVNSALSNMIDTHADFSVLAPKMQARVKDYMETRSGFWCNDVGDFKTSQSYISILNPYETTTQQFSEWLTKQAEEKGLSLTLDIPGASRPIIRLSEFRTSMWASFGIAVDNVISPDLIARFVTSISETGHQIKRVTQKTWGALVRIFTQEQAPDAAPRPAPSFDRAKAKAQIQKDLKLLLSKDCIRFLLLVNADAYKKVGFGERLMTALEAAGESADSTAPRPSDTREEAVARAAQGFTQIVQRSDELIQQRRGEILKAGGGPIFTAYQEINDAVELAFNSWSASVGDTLRGLVQNLVAQQAGRPATLPPDQLTELADLLKGLQTYVETPTASAELVAAWEPAKKAMARHQAPGKVA